MKIGVILSVSTATLFSTEQGILEQGNKYKIKMVRFDLQFCWNRSPHENGISKRNKK